MKQPREKISFIYFYGCIYLIKLILCSVTFNNSQIILYTIRLVNEKQNGHYFEQTLLKHKIGTDIYLKNLNGESYAKEANKA